MYKVNKSKLLVFVIYPGFLHDTIVNSIRLNAKINMNNDAIGFPESGIAIKAYKVFPHTYNTK